MEYAPSTRLTELASRYAARGEVPPGEAFQRAFNRFLKPHRESLLDLTIAAASVQIACDAGPQDVDPLLLRAIRDTSPSLTEAGLFGLDDAALQGVVNTAKGKYFEYLVVDKLNHGEQVGPLLLDSGQHAALADSMSQPGWDLRIVDGDGDVLEYLQLKATESVGYIHSTLQRYPDIQILATTEVAQDGLVLDSGISDEDLRAHVVDAVDAADTSLTESFFDYFHPLLPLAAMSLYEGYRLAVGAQSLDAFKMALARRSQRIAATQLIGATVYALGGGYLSAPLAFAGGLAFDRTVNQASMAGSYRSHRDKLLALRLLQQEREMSRTI